MSDTGQHEFVRATNNCGIICDERLSPEMIECLLHRSEIAGFVVDERNPWLHDRSRLQQSFGTRQHSRQPLFNRILKIVNVCLLSRPLLELTPQAVEVDGGNVVNAPAIAVAVGLNCNCWFDHGMQLSDDPRDVGGVAVFLQTLVDEY